MRECFLKKVEGRTGGEEPRLALRVAVLPIGAYLEMTRPNEMGFSFLDDEGEGMGALVGEIDGEGGE
jgi:hypothetical protein